MDRCDGPENTSSAQSANTPALVHLRGTLFLPGQEGPLSEESQRQGSILHTVPVSQEHLIVHTRSSVALYHLPTQTPLWTIACSSFNFALDYQQSLLALTPDDQGDSIVVWDMHSGHILHQLAYAGSGDPYRICPNGLAFSSDARLLAVGLENDEETRIALWDMTDGRLFGTLETDGYDDITALAFHPSGNLLAGGSFNNRKVWFWSLDDGRLLNVWEMDCNDRPYDLAFDPAGTLLLVGWGDCGLRVWDMEKGREVPNIISTLHPTEITVAPDGQSLAVAHFGGVRSRDVRILEMRTWHPLYTFAGSYPSESFSPDGKILVTSEEHGHIYVWQVATQQLLYTL